MSQTFPTLEHNLGTYGTFYVYAIIVAAGIPIIFKVLPETKNVSLEVIKTYFISKEIVEAIASLPGTRRPSISGNPDYERREDDFVVNVQALPIK